MDLSFRFFSRFGDLVILSVITLIGVAIRASFVFDPVRYDEAYTYLNFVRLPFVTTLSDYSLPNNHILHSLLVKCFVLLFGDTELVLRSVALFFGVILIPFTYYVARLYVSRVYALFVSLCVAFSHYAIFYSVNARGYTLSAFLLLLGVLILHRCVSDRTLKYPLFLGLISASALFTVPSNAPFILALYVGWFYLMQTRHVIRWYPLFFSGFFGIFVTLLLYSGVIARSGLGQITNNDFVARLTYHEFFSRLAISLNEWITSFTLDTPLVFSVFLLGFFLVGLWISVRSRQIPGLLFVVTGVWLVVCAQLPPSRVLFPLVPFFYLLVLQGFEFLYMLYHRYFDISRYYFYIITIFLVYFIFFSRFSIASLPETGYFPDHRAACNKIHEISTRNDRVKVVDGDAAFDFCYFKDDLEYYKDFSGKVYWVYTDNSYGRDWINQNLAGIPYTQEACIGTVNIVSVMFDPRTFSQ